MVSIRLLCILPDNSESLKVKALLRTFPLFQVRDLSCSGDVNLKEAPAAEADLLILNDDLLKKDFAGFIEELKNRSEFIIVSSDPALGIKAFEKGAAGFLVHPVTPEKMALALWRAYERLCFRPRSERKRD
jgi:DNA-binding NarL/FixJ family response regulator